jgi:hypothetical protein
LNNSEGGCAIPNQKSQLSAKIAKLQKAQAKKPEALAIPKKTKRFGGPRKRAGRPWEFARLTVGKEAYKKLLEICALQEELFSDSTPPLDLLQEQIDTYLKGLDATIDELKKEKIERAAQEAKEAAKG